MLVKQQSPMNGSCYHQSRGLSSMKLLALTLCVEDAALRQGEVGVRWLFPLSWGLQGVRVSSDPVLSDRFIGKHPDPKAA